MPPRVFFQRSLISALRYSSASVRRIISALISFESLVSFSARAVVSSLMRASTSMNAVLTAFAPKSSTSNRPPPTSVMRSVFHAFCGITTMSLPNLPFDEYVMSLPQSSTSVSFIVGCDDVIFAATMNSRAICGSV